MKQKNEYSSVTLAFIKKHFTTETIEQIKGQTKDETGVIEFPFNLQGFATEMDELIRDLVQDKGILSALLKKIYELEGRKNKPMAIEIYNTLRQAGLKEHQVEKL